MRSPGAAEARTGAKQHTSPAQTARDREATAVRPYLHLFRVCRLDSGYFPEMIEGEFFPAKRLRSGNWKRMLADISMPEACVFARIGAPDP